MVPAPAFFTLAGQEQRIPNSRSVAVSWILSPSASTNTFERIGIVVFFSTTPCERFNSRTRSALLTVNSMDGSFARCLSLQPFEDSYSKRLEFLGIVETLISF